MNDKLCSIDKDTTGRKERMNKIQVVFRMIDQEWNLNGFGLFKMIVCYLLCLFVTFWYFFAGKGRFAGGYLVTASLNLILFACFLMKRPSAPGLKAKRRDKEELTEILKETTRYTRVLSTLPMRMKDFYLLCFQRWWKVCSTLLILASAIFSITLCAVLKKVPKMDLPELVFFLLMPLFLFLFALGNTFPGKGRNAGVIKNSSTVCISCAFLFCLYRLTDGILRFLSSPSGKEGANAKELIPVIKLESVYAIFPILIMTVFCLLFFFLYRLILKRMKNTSFHIDFADTKTEK